MISKFKRTAMISSTIALSLLVSACSSETSSEGANTENFPEDNVEIIVPFGAGDTMDLASHALSKEFEEITGEQLVVNNQPGGAGVPGTMALINADSDGYTVGMIPSGQLVVRPLGQEVDYTLDDFTPIIGVGDFQMHPVAAADAPYDTLEEMVDYLLENDEVLTVGTPGVNTYSHIFAELLANETGIKYEHLPYAGGPEVVSQILGGHVDIGVINVSNVADGVESGTLKILGFPTEERVESYPDVPTVKEQGIDIVGGPTFGIYGPAGMPEEVVEKLRETFLEAIETESFKEFADSNSILLTKTPPEDMMNQIENEIEVISETVDFE